MNPASECVHCGFCLETCPTYVLTGREDESPRGRILLAHALQEGRAPIEPATLAPLDHCLGCLACETACPSGVPYRDILYQARKQASQAGHVRHPLERFLLQHVIMHPNRLRVLLSVYRALGLRMIFRAAAKGLPRRFRERAELSPSAEPAAPPSMSAPPPPAGAPKAILLRGCAARVFMPATENAMASLLERAGYRVERRDRPRCCGALAHHAGLHALAGALAGETVAALLGDGILVPTAAGCGAHLRDLTSVHPDALEARSLAARVRDLSEALLEGPRTLTFRAAPPAERVVFQDPCHLRHAQGIVEEPRRLLEATGVRLVEAEEAELCCGSAGSYHLAVPELSAPLARKKRDALLATGADTVVTANPGCWMQLNAVWPKHGPRLLTLARFLEERSVSNPSLPRTGQVEDHFRSSNSGTHAI